MKEQLISFETAKLAKEKGFDISTHSYYFEDNKLEDTSDPATVFLINHLLTLNDE